ncbi:Fungalysin metallopeptidase-domain-containing protein [Globomyces pollinis-pini]|nr:Fungalysin metallopeptidase-domain-containing protein [Globomyces pollinis-pini]
MALCFRGMVSVVSLDEAVKKAVKELNTPRDSIPAKFVYVQVASGKLVYAHQFQLQNSDSSKFYQVSVAADNGQLIQVVDFVNKASYKVIALPKNDPRDGFSTVTDPADVTASPNGWHKDTTSYTDSQGNNAISAVSGTTATGGSTLNFDTAFASGSAPTTTANKRAATVNAFYLVNVLHDITYKYGFTEAAGNFQNTNFGKGGKGNDRVKINNQASGTNNANFATPPDGQSGVMNMFRFTLTTPNRDGSLDNGIPVHEFVHGVSNRLTGGSAQGNCLQTTESGGMGEGWSDTVAMYLERKATDTRATDVTMGSYAVNKPAGIRSYPYSTSLTTNPLIFDSLNTLDEVHDIGEVWATLLNEVYWNLVDQYGFSSNWKDANQTKGNIIALRIVIGGMKLQPCNPSFIQARDAIIKADENIYQGANKCAIWKAFAKRGLGTDADDSSSYVTSDAVPAEC